jgi:hypothetical protein
MKWDLNYESKLLFIELQYPYSHLKLIGIASFYGAYTLLGKSCNWGYEKRPL